MNSQQTHWWEVPAGVWPANFLVHKLPHSDSIWEVYLFITVGLLWLERIICKWTRSEPWRPQSKVLTLHTTISNRMSEDISDHFYKQLSHWKAPYFFRCMVMSPRQHKIYNELWHYLWMYLPLSSLCVGFVSSVPTPRDFLCQCHLPLL